MSDAEDKDVGDAPRHSSHRPRTVKADLQLSTREQVNERLLLGANDAARFLGVHRSTLHLAVRRELLIPDSTTPGGHHRFSQATLERFRERLRTEPITTDPAANRYTQALAQVAHAVAAGEPAERVAQTAVHLLRHEQGGVHMVCLASPVATSGEPSRLRLCEQEGFPEWFFKAYARLRPSLEQAAVRVLYTHEPFLSQDCRNDTGQVARLVSLAGIRSYAVLPVVRGQEAVGVLVVASKAPKHFTVGELAFLRGVADALAVAFRPSKTGDEQARAAQMLRATRALTEKGVQLARKYMAHREVVAKPQLSARRSEAMPCVLADDTEFDQRQDLPGEIQRDLAALGALFKRETGAIEVCALGFDPRYKLQPASYELSAATCAACAGNELFHQSANENGRDQTILAASVQGRRGERAGVAARWSEAFSPSELEHSLLIAFAGAVTLLLGAAAEGGALYA